VFFSSRYSICGSATVNYLLEKSRVVNPAQGERNFHVLYQLACSRKKFPQFKLNPPSEYKILTTGGEVTVAHVNDCKEFDELVQALSDLGFDETTRKEMMTIVATILHLGQVSFSESADGEGEITRFTAHRSSSLTLIQNQINPSKFNCRIHRDGRPTAWRPASILGLQHSHSSKVRN